MKVKKGDRGGRRPVQRRWQPVCAIRSAGGESVAPWQDLFFRAVFTGRLRVGWYEDARPDNQQTNARHSTQRVAPKPNGTLLATTEITLAPLPPESRGSASWLYSGRQAGGHGTVPRCSNLFYCTTCHREACLPCNARKHVSYRKKAQLLL